jgi:hypothetical protein
VGLLFCAIVLLSLPRQPELLAVCNWRLLAPKPFRLQPPAIAGRGARGWLFGHRSGDSQQGRFGCAFEPQKCSTLPSLAAARRLLQPNSCETLEPLGSAPDSLHFVQNHIVEVICYHVSCLPICRDKAPGALQKAAAAGLAAVFLSNVAPALAAEQGALLDEILGSGKTVKVQQIGTWAGDCGSLQISLHRRPPLLDRGIMRPWDGAFHRARSW